jgi:ppGpp synthetase/RelA/SpoT-type nucleotidyltranferase
MSTPSGSDIVSQFIARYRREFDFFEHAGRIVAQQLEAQLEASGIRAMVTSRAKNPKRLESKVRQRNEEKHYATVDDIYKDIVDLAGVRVALYFPAERIEVDKIIQERYALGEEPKIFEGTSNTNPSYRKRFSGYWATHYRLQIHESTLPDTDNRFAEARVEVQVASVLMHAWSEVEHDLVYKPLQGSLSEDELAILDELNGMVLVGEIALERLQRAAEIRLSEQGAKFENHYDLASFLVKYGRSKFGDLAGEPVIGDVELLYRFLVMLGISTAEQLRPYLEGLVPDTERRPIAEQITDQILVANSDRYSAYAMARGQDETVDFGQTVNAMVLRPVAQNPKHHAIGYFLSQWIKFEQFIRELAALRNLGSDGKSPAMLPKLRKFEDVFSSKQLTDIEQIRRVRNYLVHGIENPEPEFVESLGRDLHQMLHSFLTSELPDVREAARGALGGEDDDRALA